MPLQPHYTLDNEFPLIKRGANQLSREFYSLRAPEPDFVLGLQLGFGKDANEKEDKPSTTQPTFSAFWGEHHAVHATALAMLEKHVVTTLHPRPAPQAMLVHPCLGLVIRSDYGNLWTAGNQLAGALAFALDQQEELRLLAGILMQERMPVFGVASTGDDVNLWYGAYIGYDIVSSMSRLCPVIYQSHPDSLSCHST